MKLGVTIMAVPFIAAVTLFAASPDIPETPKVEVDLIAGTINGTPMAELTLDAMTDLLGPPAYASDWLGRETTDTSKVAFLHYPSLGIRLDLQERKLEAVGFTLVARPVTDLSVREETRKLLGQTGGLLGAIEELTVKLKKANEWKYSAFDGSFTPQINARTKLKHTGDLFPHDVLKEVPTVIEADDSYHMDWQVLAFRESPHTVELIYDPLTKFIQTVKVSKSRLVETAPIVSPSMEDESAQDEVITEAPKIESTTLTIRTEALDPQISFVGKELAYEPGMELEPGTYTVRIEAPSYLDTTAEVIVNANTSNTATVKLEKSPWTTATGKSKLDDSPMVTIYNTELGADPDRFLDRPTHLILRCRENRTTAYFNLGNFSFFHKSTPVHLRFDSEGANTRRMSPSTDGKALFFRSAIPMIKRMMKHDNLFVRVDSRQGRKEATFDLRNLENEIKPLREACHW